jgi:hypothetical protein
VISCSFYLFLLIAANQISQTAVQQCFFCSVVYSHGVNFSNTYVMPISVVRIACAYSIRPIVSRQNGSCLHFRVYRVSVGDSSHVPYCRKLNMAHCRVKCGHSTIDEVTYLLLGKIVQTVLFEYWPEQHCCTLMLRNLGSKYLMNVAWTWINVVLVGIVNYLLFIWFV